MPLTIEELDHLSLIGTRAVGDLNQNSSLDPWSRPDLSWSENMALLEELDFEQHRAHRIAVYLNSPPKKFADQICLLSPAERLEELGNPLSSIRWSYSLILEHMLHASSLPAANHPLEFLQAAQLGLEVCIWALSPVDGRYESIEKFSTALPFHMALTHVLQSLVDYKLCDDVDKAMSHTVSMNDIELAASCTICCNSLTMGETSLEKRNGILCHDEKLCGELEDFTNFVWGQEADEEAWHDFMAHNSTRTMRRLHAEEHEFALSGGVSTGKFHRILNLPEHPPSRFYEEWKEKQPQANHPTPATILVRSTVKLSCNHVFHRECVKIWLLDHGNCPNCRRVTNEVSGLVHRGPDNRPGEYPGLMVLTGLGRLGGELFLEDDADYAFLMDDVQDELERAMVDIDTVEEAATPATDMDDVHSVLGRAMMDIFTFEEATTPAAADATLN